MLLKSTTIPKRLHYFVKEFTLKRQRRSGADPPPIDHAVHVLRNHIWLGDCIGRCTIVRPGHPIVGEVRKITNLSLFSYCEEITDWKHIDDKQSLFRLEYQLVDSGREDRQAPQWSPIRNHHATVIMQQQQEEEETDDTEQVHVHWCVAHDSPTWFTPIFHRILDQNVGVAIPKTFQEKFGGDNVNH